MCDRNATEIAMFMHRRRLRESFLVRITQWCNDKEMNVIQARKSVFIEQAIHIVKKSIQQKVLFNWCTVIERKRSLGLRSIGLFY